MSPEQEAFVQMLEDNNLTPNLVMKNNGKDWTEVTIDLRILRDAKTVTLTFDPDGKLINVDVG